KVAHALLVDVWIGIGPDGADNGHLIGQRSQVLIVIAEVNEVAALNDTRGGILITHEDAQKSGFPAAVGAHDAEALAALERKAQVAEERTVVRLGELVH